MTLATRLCTVGFSVALALASIPVAAGEAENKKQALELFAQSDKAYQAGRFEDSVALLEKAYALYPEPVLLYNLARSQEGLGRFEQAIDAYERYLKEAKDIRDRGAIEQRVATMKKTLEDKRRLAEERDAALKRNDAAAKEPGANDPPDAAPSDAPGPSPWPWVIAGVGGAALGAGGVLGGLALSKNDDAEGAGSQQEAVETRSSAEDLALGSTILLVSGGVVLGAGAIWGIVDLATGSSDETTPASARPVDVWIGPTGAAVRVRF